VKTITVTGGDLYHIALDQLNDATQWNRIAQLNDLLDPVLSGVTTLKIPSINAQAGGGVLVL
jgi:hypothetical protein